MPQLYKDCLFLAKFMGRRVSWADGLGGEAHGRTTCTSTIHHRQHVFSPACANQQQGNETVLMQQVRLQFKSNMKEVDDDKVGGAEEAHGVGVRAACCQ